VMCWSRSTNFLEAVAMAVPNGLNPPGGHLHTHRAARKYDFDHRIPCLMMVVGVLAVAAGGALPWREATGPKLGVNIDILSVQLQGQRSVGGLDKGASGRLALILIADAGALLAAVALMARQRRRGLVLRLVAVLCGGCTGVLGAYFLTASDQNRVDGFLSAVGLASNKPGPGAYLLVFGSLVVLVGAIMPGQRKRAREVA